MLRLGAFGLLFVALVVFAESAAAAECGLCLDSVGLQTRDGQPWTAGKPVTLVVFVTSPAGAPPPATARAVVMQTDGDRTKCLDVPLKLVESAAAGGVYAGVFFPFRPARYDGKLVIGDDIQDITFDVNQMLAGAAPAGELPEAEPLDTSAPAPALAPTSQLLALAGAALLAWPLVRLLLHTRQRRVSQPA